MVLSAGTTILAQEEPQLGRGRQAASQPRTEIFYLPPALLPFQQEILGCSPSPPSSPSLPHRAQHVPRTGAATPGGTGGHHRQPPGCEEASRGQAWARLAGKAGRASPRCPWGHPPPASESPALQGPATIAPKGRGHCPHLFPLGSPCSAQPWAGTNLLLPLRLSPPGFSSSSLQGCPGLPGEPPFALGAAPRQPSARSSACEPRRAGTAPSAPATLQPPLHEGETAGSKQAPSIPPQPTRARENKIAPKGAAPRSLGDSRAASQALGLLFSEPRRRARASARGGQGVHSLPGTEGSAGRGRAAWQGELLALSSARWRAGD